MLDKEKMWMWIAIGVTVLLVASILFGLVGWSKSNYFQEEYDSCSEKGDDCSSNLKSCESDLESQESTLKICQAEVNKIKGGWDYYYSQKMHPKDNEIKAIATQAITDFENEDTCSEWESVCPLFLENGECIKWGRKCIDWNYKRTYLIDIGSSGMEKYYQKAIISNYYWVKENIEYVLGFTGGKGAQDDLTTLSIRGGKCDEQALLLSSMLKGVGIDARVTLAGDNHAITAVNYPGLKEGDMPGKYVTFEGKPFFLMDTTCKNCGIGILPYPPTDIKVTKFIDVN